MPWWRKRRRDGDRDPVKVAVVGAGTMGNGIAHVFALHGHPVTLIDSDPAALRNGMDTIARNLERQVSKQAISAFEVLSRFKTVFTR